SSALARMSLWRARRAFERLLVSRIASLGRVFRFLVRLPGDGHAQASRHIRKRRGCSAGGLVPERRQMCRGIRWFGNFVCVYNKLEVRKWSWRVSWKRLSPQGMGSKYVHRGGLVCDELTSKTPPKRSLDGAPYGVF